MAIEVTCPRCGAVLPAPEELAGRQIRCADCEAVVEVPGREPPPVAADERPKKNWEDEDRTATAPRANVLTGTAVGWLLVLGLLACAGLVMLGMALIPV